MFTAAGKSAAASSAVYVEDVFSTYLYAGTAGDSTITNGINLSGRGGLVWIKARTTVGGANQSHALFDTSRGATKFLSSNNTSAETTEAQSLKSFTSTGFTLGGRQEVNGNAANYVSWTFRDQAKFFDVVTYTGNGVSNRTIAHNLGSVPGCIIVKRLSAADGWAVWHRSLSAGNVLELNLAAAQTALYSTWFGSNLPTSTEFNLGTDTRTNGNGSTYVAYLFAHDAGGFGATGSDNVITCGSYTGAAATVTVNLGWEPQWVLIKRATGGAGDWVVLDNMRGVGPIAATNTTVANQLFPNLSDAEANAGSSNFGISATGFSVGSGWGGGNAAAGSNYIYIAIRRGPMKTPTSGTSVFNPAISTQPLDSNNPLPNPGFVVDTLLFKPRSLGLSSSMSDRLRGTVISDTATAAAEYGQYLNWNAAQTVLRGGAQAYSTGATDFVWYFLGRAPGFFDVVCYTGTGSATTFNHNLQVVPDMMIVKRRNTTGGWSVYNSLSGNSKVVFFDTAAEINTNNHWNNTTPTSSVFTVGTNTDVNASGSTYVNYLFASLAGISKVGTYTGTGALQTINCGFSSGARFVLIKRLNSTGDWWVYDSARGITSGNDPYFLINSTANDVTNTNYVDTTSVGFQVTAAAPAGLNAVGGTYLFLAIA